MQHSKNFEEKQKNLIMNNKYYTPEVEEFRVGFEYEYFENDIWTSYILDEPYINALWNQTCMGKVRVKYLDEKDIEDLGFINWTVEWSDPARYYFTKSLLDGYESIKKGIQLFFIFGSYDRDHITIYNIIDEVKQILFDGVVKNKFELKVLLKQLNIS